jgi:hypothetical protein
MTMTRRGTRSALSKLTAKTATEICQRFTLGEGAQALLRPELTPRQYLDLLTEKGQLEDAVRFLSHTLAKPDAVRWAVQCARDAGGPDATPKAAAALAAAEKWASDPSEPNRLAAFPAAQEAGLETAAGCAALGAFFSGGSLAPANVPPIPPDESLTARVVAGAILIAATGGDPEKARERYRSYLAMGRGPGPGASRQTRSRSTRR